MVVIKKQKILFLLCLSIAVVLLTVFVARLQKIQRNQDISDVVAFHKNSTAVAAALEQQGWDMKETAVERLIPVSFKNKSGSLITFYEYRYARLKAEEEDSFPLLYREVLNPETAESALECQVGNISAYIYEKSGLSYLWWVPEEETVLVLRYDAQQVTQNEMIQMAESCAKISLKE